MREFRYILDKIGSATFTSEPFRHIEIAEFFSPEHFDAITADPQIRLPEASDDRDLLGKLHAAGYKEIKFPGTTTAIETYLAWHAARARQEGVNHPACEGFGVTLRLLRPRSGSLLDRLDRFLQSETFWSALARKFDIPLERVVPDSGIQKYLDGYEISPHPDVRRKALTYMVNINPAPASEKLEIHTHYMRFLPEHDHIRIGWRDDTSTDRDWVTWDKCETVKQQRRNNSIVIFAPSEETLHAVRTHYDHLPTQRTQCYGNLWYRPPGARMNTYWGLPGVVRRFVKGRAAIRA
jgi:hypothetical protein